jgi:hypothetical protein
LFWFLVNVQVKGGGQECPPHAGILCKGLASMRV